MNAVNDAPTATAASGESSDDQSVVVALSGDDIDGEDSDDNSGISVSLSSDGTIVAIGSHFNDNNGFSNSKAYKDLNFSPKYSFKDLIKDMINSDLEEAKKELK